MQKGSKLSESRKKDTLRHDLITYKHKYEQAQYELELTKQRLDDCMAKLKSMSGNEQLNG